MKPRMFLTKLGRYWFRHFPSQYNRQFARNYFRKWCVKEELLTDTLENFKMKVSPYDYVSYSIFFFGTYDSDMSLYLRANIHEGFTCWDIGTERGWFSLLMGYLVTPGGRVDGFEAYKPNYTKLCENIAINHFDWVHPINKAVSNHNGATWFVPPSDNITNNISFLQGGSGIGYLSGNPIPGCIEVPTTTLDEFAAVSDLSRLDLIKMDIEGAELAALQGGYHVIRKYRPKIIVEYNRLTAQRAGTSIGELDDLINSYGYDRFTFFGRLERLQLEKWDDLSDEETVFNVYCLPKENRSW